jgi:lipopolysaccharide/colanic/teichoic acid biosynthesis glycosyltransferase
MSPRAERPAPSRASHPVEHAAKRVVDVVFAASALIVLAPAMAIISLLIRVRMGPPVLFRQERPGYRGVPFTMLKFRTMLEERTRGGAPIPEKERITRLGAILRRTSLDELPEAWNILLGEMSIVGPRPLLSEYLDLYTDEQMRRHDVKPGLTGWAQVHGRRRQPMQERLAYDVWYVDNWSLRLDARILLMTIGQVVRGSGAEPEKFLDVSQLGFVRYRDGETPQPNPGGTEATEE